MKILNENSKSQIWSDSIHWLFNLHLRLCSILGGGCHPKKFDHGPVSLPVPHSFHKEQLSNYLSLANWPVFRKGGVLRSTSSPVTGTADHTSKKGSICLLLFKNAVLLMCSSKIRKEKNSLTPDWPSFSEEGGKLQLSWRRSHVSELHPPCEHPSLDQEMSVV